MSDLGVKFDSQRGIIPNDGHGRILALGGQDIAALPGLYCSGWVKRGPTGVIASTMEDAFSTAAAIAEDWETKAPFLNGGDGWHTLKAELNKASQTVDWHGWQRIDTTEKQEGMKRAKEREKLTSVDEMLKILT